jgi:hypothetical protein
MRIRLNAVSSLFRLLFQVLVLTVIISASGHAFPSTSAPMNATSLYEELHSRGLGSDVKVTKADGTVIKGTLVELEIDSFEVVPKDAVHPTRIPDTQVARVDNAGLSKIAKEAIGALVGLVVVIGLIAIATSPTTNMLIPESDGDAGRRRWVSIL